MIAPRALAGGLRAARPGRDPAEPRPDRRCGKMTALEEGGHVGVGAEERSAQDAETLRDLAAFPLLEALYGRRSRRFALGDEIPGGPLATARGRSPSRSPSSSACSS